MKPLGDDFNKLGLRNSGRVGTCFCASTLEQVADFTVDKIHIGFIDLQKLGQLTPFFKLTLLDDSIILREESPTITRHLSELFDEYSEDADLERGSK